MKLYFHYFLMQLKSQMEYRASFWLATVGQFITAFTSFFGIAFIFDKISAVGDFNYGQVLLCFAVVMMAFSIGEMFGGGLAVFAGLLGNGSFDRILVRPRSAILQVLAPHTDFTRIGLTVQAAVVLGYAVPRSGVVWTSQRVAVLALMVLCGSVVFFALFLITASASFFTVQPMDFLNVFTYGARSFGRYPFGVYGDGVLKFFTFVIPLACFQYYPLLYLIGRTDAPAAALCPLLSVLFLLPAYLFFRYGLRKYKSTGS